MNTHVVRDSVLSMNMNSVKIKNSLSTNSVNYKRAVLDLTNSMNEGIDENKVIHLYKDEMVKSKAYQVGNARDKKSKNSYKD